MTDLQNAVGKQKFEVKSRSTYEYLLEITPLLGGEYTGQITFEDREGRYLWWTVEVNTSKSRPEKIVTMAAFVRKAATAEIVLSNPLNEPINFDVFYSGEGLIGESTFYLEPHQDAVYNLIYSPL